MIQDICKSFLTQEAADINLFLGELGLEKIDPRNWSYDENDNWSPTVEDRKQIAYDILNPLSWDQLLILYNALAELGPSDQLTLNNNSDELSQPLLLFASHLTDEKRIVSEIGEKLDLLGVTLFVAHEDIRPSKDFQVEIERSLSEAHGGVIFFHDDFIESKWCDQEVGWLVGRGVPVFTLKFARAAPHGFIARAQALPISENTKIEKILDELMNWAHTQDQLRPRLADSLLQKLRLSGSFLTTNSIWKYLGLHKDLSTAQIETLLSITIENSQVHGAECRVGLPNEGRGRKYPEVLSSFIDKQDKFDSSTPTTAEFRKMFK
jgi:hypothetical protein